MKRNVLIKGFLLLIVVSILAIGFTGCAPMTYPTTGTVYLTIANDNYWYDIYIDGIWQNVTNGYGNLTITNVPIGNHLFEAYDTSWLSLYGSKWQYINPGANYVTIYTY